MFNKFQIEERSKMQYRLFRVCMPFRCTTNCTTWATIGPVNTGFTLYLVQFNPHPGLYFSEISSSISGEHNNIKDTFKSFNVKNVPFIYWVVYCSSWKCLQLFKTCSSKRTIKLTVLLQMPVKHPFTHISLFIKSKLRDIIFLQFWLLSTRKYACPEFFRA